MTVDERMDDSRAQDDGGVAAVYPPVARVGRKRDLTRDDAILRAALEVLAEVGYAGMTMDMVAERARAGKATIYRRWPSKAELVVDAAARMKRDVFDLDQLPDTGTLRGDLVALIKPQSMAEEECKLKVIGGLSSMISDEPTLADAVYAAVSTPWVDANRLLMRRAIDRGEFAEPAHFETLAHVVPSLAAFRVLVQRRSVDRMFLISLIDGVLLPALRATPVARQVLPE